VWQAGVTLVVNGYTNRYATLEEILTSSRKDDSVPPATAPMTARGVTTTLGDAVAAFQSTQRRAANMAADKALLHALVDVDRHKLEQVLSGPFHLKPLPLALPLTLPSRSLPLVAGAVQPAVERLQVHAQVSCEW